MYTHQNGFVEDCCYDFNHVEEVIKEIRINFKQYFEKFVETDGGTLLTSKEFAELKKKFKISTSASSKSNYKSNFKTLILEAYEDFEKDRQKYFELFDMENLEESEDDPAQFKAKTLKLECPIIHATLFNKRAKELEKYRRDFSLSDPDELLSVITNLSEFAREYIEGIYAEENYDEIDCYEDMCLGELDTEDYTVYGVIGGGIKSHMLYKVQPSTFPNRSRSAIWAFWFLTDKKSFGCEMDSEFIMIDLDKNIVQQNYFYPYELFAFYAYQIYLLLKEKAEECDIYINSEYRYVVVDRFLKFVADEHDEEISFLKSQIRDGGMGYV